MVLHCVLNVKTCHLVLRYIFNVKISERWVFGFYCLKLCNFSTRKMSEKKLMLSKAITDGNKVVLSNKVIPFLPFNTLGDIVINIIRNHTQNNNIFDLSGISKITCNEMDITDCITYSIKEIEAICSKIMSCVIIITIKNGCISQKGPKKNSFKIMMDNAGKKLSFLSNNSIFFLE